MARMAPPNMPMMGGPPAGPDTAENPPDDQKIIAQVTNMLTQALDLLSQIQGPPEAPAAPPGPGEQFGNAFNQAAAK